MNERRTRGRSGGTLTLLTVLNCLMATSLTVGFFALWNATKITLGFAEVIYDIIFAVLLLVLISITAAFLKTTISITKGRKNQYWFYGLLVGILFSIALGWYLSTVLIWTNTVLTLAAAMLVFGISGLFFPRIITRTNPNLSTV